MQGGVPIRIGGTVVGPVGVSGLDKSKDVEISLTAAAATEGGRSAGSHHYDKSSIRDFAALRSLVSNPSVNRS
jgi:hypothetical protein